jgi:hypothetical protein
MLSCRFSEGDNKIYRRVFFPRKKLVLSAVLYECHSCSHTRRRAKGSVPKQERSDSKAEIVT